MATSASRSSSVTGSRRHRTGQWTTDEHERFIDARTLHPTATWRMLAAYVGTRSTRQCMTHANKIAEKAERMARGLRPAGRPRGATSRPNRSASRKRSNGTPYERQSTATTRTSSTDRQSTLSLPELFSDFPAILDVPELDDALSLLLPECWTAAPPNSPTGVADFPHWVRPFEADQWVDSLLLTIDDF